MRRLLLSLLASLSSCTVTWADNIPGDGILLGTVYNIFHEEYASDAEFFAQVDKDVPAMAAANMEHILIFPMSEWDPATKKLKWERTDYLIRAIEKAGLKFVPLMLKEEQNAHYFPIWKFDELPQIKSQHLSRGGGANTRQTVDFANPAVYPLVEEYFREVVERYGKSPALSFYNIWNEPHYWSDSDHVVERFRDWLKAKYTDLAGLRRAWGEDYTDWSQVTPFLNDDWNSSLPRMDWLKFRSELPGHLLGELTKSLRKFDSKHAINANPVGTVFAGYSELGYYTTDNWQFTAYNDFNGISYYPDGWDREKAPTPQPLWNHNLTFNVVRSAAGDKGYLLTEIYTNAKSGLTLGGYLDGPAIQQLAWLSLANECRGMLYWKWEPFRRGRQSLGRGLVTLEGTLAPRGEAIRDFGAVMKKHGKLIREAKLEKPQVAIILDAYSMLKTVEQEFDGRSKKFFHESHLGLFRALDEENITSDVLRADIGITLEQLKTYKAVFLPFQVVLRRDLAPVLAEYVKQGGWLIADARTATVDELDYAYSTSPGAGLDTVFGAARIDWNGREARGLAPVVATKAFGSDFAFDGRYFREKLRLSTGVSVLAEFSDTKEPALVAHKFGSGTAVLAAVPLGGSYALDANPAVRALIRSLCDRAGVTQSATFKDANGNAAMVRVHKAGETTLVYVLNASQAALDGELHVKLPAAPKTVIDLATGETLNAKASSGSVTIPIKLPVTGTRCIELR